MKFHLNYTPAAPGFEIDHGHALFLVGSCFSENIGKLLHDTKFKVQNNPWGILFNPLSIHNCLDTLVCAKPFDETLVLQRGDEYLSYWHHSSVNNNNHQTLVSAINANNKTVRASLITSDHLFITFGTAYYYYHKTLKLAVANCHKQPGNLFEKKLLSVAEIIEAYTLLLQQLKKLNPKLKIIFTVSPVKHLKDGVVENNISKSTLILAIHELTKAHDHCSYFPAYELINDDLRDYRFYKSDMAHPNEQAVDYVWEKFSNCYFSEQTRHINQLIESLNKALAHRQLSSDSQGQSPLQDYIEKQKAEIRKLLPGFSL